MMAPKWLVLLPSLLFAALAAPILCKRLGWSAGYVFGGVAAIVAAVVVNDWRWVVEHGPVIGSIRWMPSLGLDFAVRLDGLGLFFALLISAVGGMVFVYSVGYLRDQARCGRFFFALGLFFAAMLGIALSDNLLLLFVFWELTSFASFLLIGFDHEDERARASAMQALLVTAAGGLALLGGILLLAKAGGSYSLGVLSLSGSAIRDHPYYPAATLLVLAGAFTKSAQFPFHFWLPDAMAAPTPVSAYLHSAAMVKAGIFLLLRLAPVLGGTALWQGTVSWVGWATAMIGALLALGQTDSKRMVAYATVSALGVLVMLTASAHETRYAFAAVLFLAAHALYKGALFMLAGSLAHLTGTRNVTQWSGLRHATPALAAVGIATALSMAALPPSFAFIAKEELVAVYLASPGGSAFLAAIVVASASFTAVAIAVALRPFVGPIVSVGKLHHLPSTLILGPGILVVCGLVPALFADEVGSWLGSTIAGPMTAVEAPAKLALWHGFNTELALSALSVAVGALFFVAMPAFRKLFAKAGPLAVYGPGGIYVWGVKTLLASAKLLTRALQNGRLSIYLHTFFAVLVVVGLLALQDAIPQAWAAQERTLPRFYEVLLALFITLAAFSVPTSPSPFAAVASLGMVGYGVAIAFVLFSAPDLAMTQFLIETLMIVLFVLVFYRMKDEKAPVRPGRVMGIVSAVGVGTLMAGLALLTQGYAHERPVADFFLQRSLSEAHGRNVVNVILVDFRALDTLGEITVLALAAIGVRALVAFRAPRGGGP